MWNTDDARHLGFQPFHSGPIMNCCKSQTRDGAQDFPAYRRVPEPEIEQGNLHVFVCVRPGRGHNPTIVLQGLVAHNARLDETARLG
jgi:hypothetical protein